MSFLLVQLSGNLIQSLVQCKLDAIATYGGKIIKCTPTMDAREQTCRRIEEETGATFVPPYNDARVISGQVCISAMKPFIAVSSTVGLREAAGSKMSQQWKKTCKSQPLDC